MVEVGVVDVKNDPTLSLYDSDDQLWPGKKGSTVLSVYFLICACTIQSAGCKRQLYSTQKINTR